MKGVVFWAAVAMVSFGTTVDAAKKPNQAASDASSWIQIAASDTGDVSFSAHKGSFEVAKTKDGTVVGSILGQYTIKENNTVYYYKLYASQADCAAGYGQLVLLDTDGTYSSESAFVSKGASIASGIADFICAVYDSVLEKQNGKSL